MSEQMDSDMGLDLRSDSAHKLPMLRAMGFGELLDTTFSLYRKHFRSFLGISSGYCIALLLMMAIVFLDGSVGSGVMIAIWIPTIGIFLGVSVYVVNGLILASTEAYLGGNIRIGTALKQGRHRFLRCFVGSLSFGLLAVLVIFFLLLLFVLIVRAFSEGALNFFAPLFLFLLAFFVTGWFVTYWCFFAAAVLVEGKSMSNGLRRRGELIEGNWWRIIGIMFAIFVLYIGVGLIFRIVFAVLLSSTGLVDVMGYLKMVTWTTVWQLLVTWPEHSLSYMLIYFINVGVDIFTMPIWVIGSTLLYFDQRIRKEGFDIEMMATRQGA